jgi:ABC-type Mn2+/Zn2+ transport system permease subunit
MLACAVAVAVLSTVLGTYAAALLHRPTGPMIISVAAGFFLLSLLRRRD